MGILTGVANDKVICVFEKKNQWFREKLGSMKGEKEQVKNCMLKNTTVVWDRARYLTVCPNTWATTSEVIVHPFNQPVWGVCGSKPVE